jgi:predicted transcriptional regulator of viral defense system
MQTTIITKNVIKQIKDTTDEYARTFLNRKHNSKELQRVTNGKYTKSNNIYSIATNLFTPSYLSFWSASYFKGYTEQIVNQIQVITTQKHKTIKFENYTINFTKLNKKYFFGYEKTKSGNEFVFVVNDEKLLIDAIHKEKKLGNFDEILKIIKNAKINKNKIIDYLNKINSKTLNKKVGYLLEEYKNIDISKEINYKDNNYVILSNFLDGKKINKKWKVKI